MPLATAAGDVGFASGAHWKNLFQGPLALDTTRHLVHLLIFHTMAWYVTMLIVF